MYMLAGCVYPCVFCFSGFFMHYPCCSVLMVSFSYESDVFAFQSPNLDGHLKKTRVMLSMSMGFTCEITYLLGEQHDNLLDAMALCLF